MNRRNTLCTHWYIQKPAEQTNSKTVILNMADWYFLLCNSAWPLPLLIEPIFRNRFGTYSTLSKTTLFHWISNNSFAGFWSALNVSKYDILRYQNSSPYSALNLRLKLPPFVWYHETMALTQIDSPAADWVGWSSRVWRALFTPGRSNWTAFAGRVQIWIGGSMQAVNANDVTIGTE